MPGRPTGERNLELKRAGRRALPVCQPPQLPAADRRVLAAPSHGNSVPITMHDLRLQYKIDARICNSVPLLLGVERADAALPAVQLDGAGQPVNDHRRPRFELLRARA